QSRFGSRDGKQIADPFDILGLFERGAEWNFLSTKIVDIIEGVSRQQIEQGRCGHSAFAQSNRVVFKKDCGPIGPCQQFARASQNSGLASLEIDFYQLRKCSALSSNSHS